MTRPPEEGKAPPKDNLIPVSTRCFPFKRRSFKFSTRVGPPRGVTPVPDPPGGVAPSQEVPKDGILIKESELLAKEDPSAEPSTKDLAQNSRQNLSPEVLTNLDEFGNDLSLQPKPLPSHNGNACPVTEEDKAVNTCHGRKLGG